MKKFHLLKSHFLFVFLFYFLIIPSIGLSSTEKDESARQQFMENDWILDSVVSPGHMNLGIIVGSKNVGSPSIQTWSCAVLKRHGSDLTWVRYFDVIALARQGKSLRQSEILKIHCK